MKTFEATAQTIPMLNVHPEGHLSPDGSQALIYGQGSYVAVHNLGDTPGPACPTMKPLPQNGRIQAEFIPNTPYIAVFSRVNKDSRVQIYDTVRGLPVGPPFVRYIEENSGIWVSPDGRTVAVRSWPDEMYFMDISYLYEDPSLGFGAARFAEYAKVQACAELRDARLLAIDPTETWKQIQADVPWSW
jgi:hypothetical protein